MITAQVRFKGGATQTLTVPVSHGAVHSPDSLRSWTSCSTTITDAEVAEHLNQPGWRTYEGKPFHATRVLSIRRYHHLKDHGTRLHDRGLLTAAEAATAYGVCRQTLMDWGRAGLVPMYRANGHGIALFPPPDEHAPLKNTHKYRKTRSPYGRSAVCHQSFVKGMRQVVEEGEHLLGSSQQIIQADSWRRLCLPRPRLRWDASAGGGGWAAKPRASTSKYWATHSSRSAGGAASRRALATR